MDVGEVLLQSRSSSERHTEQGINHVQEPVLPFQGEDFNVHQSDVVQVCSKETSHQKALV